MERLAILAGRFCHYLRRARGDRLAAALAELALGPKQHSSPAAYDDP